MCVGEFSLTALSIKKGARHDVSEQRSGDAGDGAQKHHLRIQVRPDDRRDRRDQRAIDRRRRLGGGRHRAHDGLSRLRGKSAPVVKGSDHDKFMVGSLNRLVTLTRREGCQTS